MSYVKVHLCYGILLLQVMRMYSNGGGYGWEYGPLSFGKMEVIFSYDNEVNSLA